MRIHRDTFVLSEDGALAIIADAEPPDAIIGLFPNGGDVESGVLAFYFYWRGLDGGVPMAMWAEDGNGSCSHQCSFVG
jgi:hypothetical protein